MKKFLAASLVAGVLFAVPNISSTVNAADNAPERGYMSVSYTTEKEVSPDTVEFSIAIKTDDKKSMQEASSKNKEISNKVYEYLKSNIKPANGDYIKTSNYSATPIYTYKDNKRIFDRYEVSNNIIVHTKTLDNVATMIDKSISMGATGVNSLNFSLAKKDEKCAEMLSFAGKEVRKRGDVVAAAVGTSITGVKNIRTSCSLNQRRVNYSYSNRVFAKAAMADGAALENAEPVTNIESGNITMYSNVDVDFFVK